MRAPGASDCEALSSGLLAQPVATLSSLAFAAAAAWLAARLPARPAAVAYAGLVGLVGAGSVLYHGPQWPGAELLHDVAIALVAAYGAAVPLSRRTRRRPALREGGGRAARAAGAAASAGLIAYLVGRTGGPLCHPGSLLQPHAAWHVFAAVALAAWGSALWEPGVRRR
jgi:peptidoglycan/LPS O-acetylase OafA/YrhL